MPEPTPQELTPYQKRLFEYLEQAMAQLPAGTTDEEASKYLEELLASVVDHDIAQELEKTLEDVTQQADELTILHAEHKESKVENQLAAIRGSI